MQAKQTSALATLSGLLFLGGCQLLAGVHADAQLTSSTTSTGAGGGGGCSTPADCPGGACLSGACVEPVCQPDHAPFDIFTAADVASLPLAASSLMLIADGQRVHVAVSQAMASHLFARTVPENAAEQLSSVVDYTFANGGQAFSGLAGSTSVVFHARNADELGELVFPKENTNLMAGGTWTPYPTLSPACTSPNTVKRVVFAQDGAATRYAAECGMSDQGDQALVLGGSDVATSIIVDQNMNNDGSLRVQHFAITGGTRLLLSGDGDLGKVFFRTGATDADLAAATPLHFSDDAAQLAVVIGVVPLSTGDGVSFLGAQVTPPPQFTGSFWGGIVKDYSALSQVPPPGIVNREVKADATKFGQPGPLFGDDSGLYWPTVPPDGKHVDLSWFSRDAQLLLLLQDVYVVPAGGSSQVIRPAVARIGTGLLVAWTEEDAGQVTVRGQRLICTY